MHCTSWASTQHRPQPSLPVLPRPLLLSRNNLLPPVKGQRRSVASVPDITPRVLPPLGASGGASGLQGGVSHQPRISDVSGASGTSASSLDDSYDLVGGDLAAMMGITSDELYTIAGGGGDSDGGGGDSGGGGGDSGGGRGRGRGPQAGGVDPVQAYLDPVQAATLAGFGFSAHLQPGDSAMSPVQPTSLASPPKPRFGSNRGAGFGLGLLNGIDSPASTPGGGGGGADAGAGAGAGRGVGWSPGRGLHQVSHDSDGAGAGAGAGAGGLPSALSFQRKRSLALPPIDPNSDEIDNLSDSEAALRRSE